jgi:hypothetical protein
MRFFVVAAAMALVGLAASLEHASAQDKRAKCEAGFKRCMDRCEREATANTGKASSPARVKYCRETFCLPEMRKHSCPGSY